MPAYVCLLFTGLKVKDVAKKLGKRLATGAGIVDNPSGGYNIELQVGVMKLFDFGCCDNSVLVLPQAWNAGVSPPQRCRWSDLSAHTAFVCFVESAPRTADLHAWRV